MRILLTLRQNGVEVNVEGQGEDPIDVTSVFDTLVDRYRGDDGYVSKAAGEKLSGEQQRKKISMRKAIRKRKREEEEI